MRWITIIIITGILACTVAPATVKCEPLELKALKAINARDSQWKSKSQMTELRPNAIRETAYSLGVQHAVKWRYGQINHLLETNSGKLDRIFNFNAHMLYNGLLMPPIVVKAGPAQRLENEKLIVFSDKTYRIIDDARLVTNAPDWRQYLLQYHDAIIDVHPSLLPKTAKEREIWQAAVERGWQAGIQHAEYLYQQGLNRLQRDIGGIIRYRILALQGVVNVPTIASARNSAEISEDNRKLQISKKVVRIMRDVMFVEESEWYPAAN